MDADSTPIAMIERLVPLAVGALSQILLGLVLLALWSIVGAAVLRVFGDWLGLHFQWALAAAAGVVTVAVVLPIAYLAGVNLLFTSVTVLAVSLVYLGWVFWHARNRPTGLLVRRTLDNALPLVICVALASIALAPVLFQGTTYWTLDSNDYPAYAAYSEMWMSDAYSSAHAAFLTKHPDAYGAHVVTWAQFDKPATTGLLTFSSQILNREAILFQGPLLLAFLALAIGLVQYIFTCLTRKAPFVSGAVAASIVLGLYSVVIFLNGQVGQIVASIATLFIVALGVSSRASGVTSKWMRDLALSIPMGLALAAALGANFLMTVAVLPVLAVTVAWLLRRRLGEWTSSLRGLAFGSAIAVALTLPFWGWHREEIAKLATGGVGPQYPLPSPLALIGLQSGFDSISGAWQLVMLWLPTFAFVSILLVRGRGSLLSPAISVLAVALASLAVLSVTVGPQNYAVAKWVAMSQVIIIPVAIASLLKMSQHRLSGGLKPLALVIGGVALANAASLSLSVPYVVPRDLFALQNDPRIADLSSLNVDLGNYFEDSAAVLLVPVKSVVAIEPIFSDEGAQPAASITLIRNDDVEYASGYEIRPLNETYGLALGSGETDS